MILASLVLIISAGLLLFYVQSTCEGILRREFARPFFKGIVNANALEFSRAREELIKSPTPPDYERLRVALKCDFLTLALLLRQSSRSAGEHFWDETLMLVYLRAQFVSLAFRHFFWLREKPAALKLTRILEYLANVVGQREADIAV